ncbi:MAG: hypothetical protein J6U14_05330 [Bacteroidaceae bacterium]|nr:hypothetical protein [Bacteroidaceae bacterium]
MKKHLLFVASLILGFMVTSCQSDMEEVIGIDKDAAITRMLDEETEETADESLRTSLSITGPSIISGTTSRSYTATGYSTSTYKTIWEPSSYLQRTDSNGDSPYASFKLVNSSSTADTYLTVKLQNRSTGHIDFTSTIDIGCNGPLAGTSSVRVVRSSDGVEVFPAIVGLSPNTFYYAYFSNSEASNMTLTWIFNHATIYNQYGYTVYFKTDSYGYTFLTVKGRMPNSSTDKTMINDITLYGAPSKSNAKKKEVVKSEEKNKGE